MAEVATLGLKVDGVGNIDRASKSLDRFTDSGRTAEQSTGAVTRESRKSSKSLADVARESDRASSGFDRLSNAARTAIGVIGTALGTREIIAYADAWQNAENQLRIVTASTDQLADVQQRLVDTAVETRSNFSATANLYARLARSTTELGLSQSDLIGLTTTINQSFAVSGATAEEASAAITQLSQGLASGALRGDEFNSVAEQAPGILRAVSDSLGLTIGELRDFAATGGITAEIVVNALQGASDTIARDFAGSVATFGQQLEVARTQLTAWAGENNNVRAIVSGLGGAIVGITGGLQTHGDAVNAVAGALAGATAAYYGYSIAAGVATAATSAFTKVLRINPLLAATSAIVSIGSAMYAARDASIQFGDTQATISDWLKATWEVNRDIVIRTTGELADGAIRAYESISAPVAAVFTYLWETFSALMGNIGRIAQTTINSIIAYWDSLTDVVAIVVRTMQTLFTSGFDNILGVAGGFWESIQAVFSGDLSFSAFNAAVDNLQKGFSDALGEAAGEIQNAVTENFSRDYLGEAFSATSDGIAFVVDDFKNLGEQISEAAFIARMSRNSFGTVAEGFSEGKTQAELLQDEIANLNDGLGEAEEASKKTAKEVSRLADSYEALLDRITPGRREARQYAQDLSTLNVALASGKISAAEYMQAMGLLQESFQEAQRETSKLADAVETESERMAKIWERQLERMDDAGVSLWRSFLSGSENAFDSFKNLAIDTLAEVIHAYTTRKITASLGISADGISPTGGLGSLLSKGSSLLGLGSAGTAAGYTGALGAATGTGYGGALGSAVAGAANSGLASSIASGISTAMPWIAGGLAIDSLLGGSITKAIGGLFGGRSRGPSFNLMTTFQDPRTIFEDAQHGVTATGAFGNVGFQGANTNRLEETFGSFDAARQFLEAIAATDDMIAALAPGDVEAMTHAIQQMRITSSDTAGIVDQLGLRAQAAFGAISGDLGAFIQTLSGSTEEIIQQAQTAQQAYDVLTRGSEQLGFQFERVGGYAYEAAQRIAAQVGGVQRLDELQQTYYQNFYSENERLTSSMQMLHAALAAVTDEVPNTIAGMRELIEAQRVAGGNSGAFATLLENAGAFAQTTGSISDKLSSAYEQFVDGGTDVSSAVEKWTGQIASGSITLDDALNEIQQSGNAAQLASSSATQAEDSRNSSIRRNTDAQKENASVIDSVTRSLNEAITSQQQRADELRSAMRRITDEAFAGPSAMQRLVAGGADLSGLSIDRNDFATLTDYLRESGQVANRLDAMADDAELSVTVAERQLRHLESIDTTLAQYEFSRQVAGRLGGQFGRLRTLELPRDNGDNNRELITEIRGLRGQVQKLESYNKDTRKFTREQWINQMRANEANL